MEFKKITRHTIYFILFCLVHWASVHCVSEMNWEQVVQLEQAGNVQDAVVRAHAVQKQSSGFSLFAQQEAIDFMREQLGMVPQQLDWYFVWAYFISWFWWFVIVFVLWMSVLYVLLRHKKIIARHLLIFCVCSGMLFLGFVQKYTLLTRKQGIIIEKNCFVKGGPDETYISVSTMEYGAMVTVQQEHNNYLFVQSKKQKGWVVKNHIKVL